MFVDLCRGGLPQDGVGGLPQELDIDFQTTFRLNDIDFQTLFGQTTIPRRQINTILNLYSTIVDLLI